MMDEEQGPSCPNLNEDIRMLPELMATLTKQTIIEFLEGEQFNKSMVSQWSDFILDKCLLLMGTLLDTLLQKDYKVIGSCIIMSKAGQHIHRASSERWNKGNEEENILPDVACTVKWENDWVVCLVSLYKLK